MGTSTNDIESVLKENMNRLNIPSGSSTLPSELLLTPDILTKKHVKWIWFITFIILVISGSLFFSFIWSNAKKPRDTIHPAPLPTISVNTPSSSPIFTANTVSSISINQILELHTFYSSDEGIVKKVFIISSPDEYALYMGDQYLSPDSLKKIHVLEAPGALNYIDGTIRQHGEYLTIAYAGGDANNLAIFDMRGNLVTGNISDNNELLMYWMLHFNSDIRTNVIKVDLFQIDSSTGSAEIDLTTGKIVPGTFKKYGNSN